jgi:hypothetical protein
LFRFLGNQAAAGVLEDAARFTHSGRNDVRFRFLASLWEPDQISPFIGYCLLISRACPRTTRPPQDNSSRSRIVRSCDDATRHLSLTNCFLCSSPPFLLYQSHLRGYGCCIVDSSRVPPFLTKRTPTSKQLLDNTTICHNVGRDRSSGVGLPP